MIIKVLADYYSALQEKGLLPSEEWAVEKVSGAICINHEGQIESIMSVMIEDPNKEGKMLPQMLSVPFWAKRTSGPKPYFLCDKSSYLLGPCCQEYLNMSEEELNGTKSYQDDLRNFALSKEYHLGLLEGIESGAAEALRKYFLNWDCSSAFEHTEVKSHPDLIDGNFVFMYQGKFIHEDPQIRERWESVFHDHGERNYVFCPVSGKNEPLCSIHPGIKGVKDAQSSGAALVSYNEVCFESYGMTKGELASIGTETAGRYTQVLNYLLSDRAHRRFVGDTTIVYWSETADQGSENILLETLFGSGDNSEKEHEFQAAVSDIAKGKKTEWKDSEIDPSVRCYVLGLAPNNARLSVRFFMQNTLQKFVENIAKHYERLEIERSDFDRPILSIPTLLHETINEKETNPPVSQMAGNLYQAVLNDTFYPSTLIQAVQRRITAEKKITYGRAAIIKAFYLKNTNPLCPKEVLTMELNEQTTYLPYVLGRVFSVLEDIQGKANPGVKLNTTIKDRYFTSASSTPALVFPTLINLAQKHLAKMNDGARIASDKKLTELLAMIDVPYPAHLTLPEQGAFQLGYYHETRKRYEKKEN